MTPEIRRAALRAAAKAALLVSFGCSSTPKATPPSNTVPAGSAATETAVPCDDYLGGLATAKREELPDGDPLKERPDVYGAFKDADARIAPRTTECCAAELHDHGSSAKHRWECCSALAATPAGGDPMACTPWGPPCPPALA